MSDPNLEVLEFVTGHEQTLKQTLQVEQMPNGTQPLEWQKNPPGTIAVLAALKNKAASTNPQTVEPKPSFA